MGKSCLGATWLEVATKCFSSLWLVVAPHQSERSHILCAWCPLFRHLGQALCECPTEAQWRIRCEVLSPITLVSDQQFACQHLGKAACRRHGCKRSTEPWVNPVKESLPGGDRD